MSCSAISFALLCLVATGQSGQPSLLDRAALTGDIERISGNEIHIRTLSKVVTVHAGPATEVTAHGTTSRDLSRLRIGGKVADRIDPSSNPSRPVAAGISAGQITFRGSILKADSAKLEVAPNPKGSSQSSVDRAVRLLPNSTTAATRFSAGSSVEVLGWDFGPGGVDAVRVIVLNSDMPISY